MNRVAFGLFAFILATTATHVAAEDGVGTVRAVIVTAVQQRIGAGTQVIVDDLEIFRIHGVEPAQAVPAPTTRLGEMTSFALVATVGTGSAAHVVPAGRATGRLRVVGPHARARHLIARGTTIGDDDIVEATDEIAGVPLRRLPTVEELRGARALQAVAAGAIVTAPAVAMIGGVRSGQLVRATATIGRAEVTAMLVSLQNGQVGDVIRVVNRDTHRELRARVSGEGAVEVIQ